MNEITALYSGDANYASSTAGQFAIDVLIPTTIQVTSSNPSVVQGTPVTFTVRIIPSQQNGPAITGSVTLTASAIGAYGIGPVPPIINGRVQVTVNASPPFLPTGSYEVVAQYYSDGNYAAATGSTVETVSPQPGTDFALGNASPSLLTISAPGAFADPVTVPVTAINGFSGTINFPASSCTISPTGSQATCQVNPAFVTGSGSLSVGIFTTSSSRIWNLSGERPGAQWWWVAIGGLASLGLVGVFVFPSGQRRWRAAFGLLSIALLATAILGCGGGSGGGNVGFGGGAGGGNPGTPTGIAYTVTVTGTCGPLTHTTSFTFKVQ
jgi:hypothetical protein